MKKVLSLVLLSFSLIIFSGYIYTSSSQTENTVWESMISLNPDPLELALIITSAMSDEQALAQTFMLGWSGGEPSPLILNWIRERNIGGVKVFGWNTDDTYRLAETIGIFQNAALETGYGIPLLVATDQEGGNVRHVRGNTSVTPGNMAIGATGLPIYAYYSGYYIGRELSLLGINMNFAPAVDLFNNRDSSLIGPRSFGSDPYMAAIMGAAFARGQEETGIIATAKHFPGHGDTPLDSHGVLPLINISLETLLERELIPYQLMIQEGIPAIMSAHIAFPQTPGGGTPASLSPWFLTELLREQLGYTGVIITDDLMMGGALNYARSAAMTARMALEAGNDIIMMSRTPQLNDAIWTYLLRTMEEEEAFRERVREACMRVLALKFQYLNTENSVPLIPDLSLLNAGLPDPEGRDFFRSLAARSVTVLNENNIFPLTHENAGRVLLAGNYTEFFNAGRRAFPGAAVYWYPSLQNMGELALHARNMDTVILLVSGRLSAASINQIRRLDADVIILSILNPGFLDELDWADGAVAVYSFSPDSFNAGFSAILGRIPGEGRFPFIIE